MLLVREAIEAVTWYFAQNYQQQETSGGNKKRGTEKAHRAGVAVLFIHIMLLSFVDRVKWDSQARIQLAYATVKCSCELCREK
jgi:hypothetical protein